MPKRNPRNRRPTVRRKTQGQLVDLLNHMAGLKIEDFLACMAPDLWDKQAPTNECPKWPGDVYALAASLLEKSGCYSYLGNHIELIPRNTPEDSNLPFVNLKGYQEHSVKVGAEWRRAYGQNHLEELPIQLPRAVMNQWARLERARKLPVHYLGLLSDIGISEELPNLKHAYAPLQQVQPARLSKISRIIKNITLRATKALFYLIAYADEALAGAGNSFAPPSPGDLPEDEDEKHQFIFAYKIERLLSPYRVDSDGRQIGSSLCDKIHPSFLRVLPKSQTPASGLSLRSLTHHLALCPPVGIRAHWYADGFSGLGDGTISQNQRNHCNLLLIPWPYSILPKQFKGIQEPNPARYTVPLDTGWFEYHPRDVTGGTLLRHVESLIDEAIDKVGHLDLIVFPELSISRSQLNIIIEDLSRSYPTLGIVTGIADASSTRVNGNTDGAGKLRHHFGVNRASVLLPMKYDDTTLGNAKYAYTGFHQNKHHRWKLDSSQITRYGLSTQLDPQKTWWEAIDVGERAINFFRLRDWLTSTVLICEDLARNDPVGRFIRAVAPDLVIALLMDGPQLKERWSAYHATVLADDPGSSVLTLTSLGMIDLSRTKPNLHEAPPRAIALWRDPVSGVTEIRLPQDCNAALLTISRFPDAELTADGRENVYLRRSERLGSPIFGGLHFLKGARFRE